MRRHQPIPSGSGIATQRQRRVQAGASPPLRAQLTGRCKRGLLPPCSPPPLQQQQRQQQPHLSRHRQPPPAAATPRQATGRQEPEQQQSLEGVIADVLNANRAQQLQRPSDLLALLDGSGHGLTTVVRRSWDTTGVRLALEGSWVGAAEARKMAMLAAYQERFVTRAGVLLRLLTWLSRERPGLLDASVVREVQARAAADEINPAVQVLMVPQLTLMAAVLHPWPVLLHVVESAMQSAQQVLFTKPPYSYSEAQRAKALQQLRWVEASLCRGAALARLKALLMQQPGQLQHWQQVAATAAAAAGGQHLAGLTGEQAYHEHWKQRQQEQQQGEAAAAASGRQGRSLCAAFHEHSRHSPWLMHSAPGTAASAAAAAASAATAAASSSSAPTLAAAAAGGGWDVSNAAAEQQQLCRVISQLTEQTRELKQQLGSTDAALGVLPQVQNAHRAALLDLLATWAEASPAIEQAAEAPLLSARVAISSIEHDRLLRRIALEASGPEVPVLRSLAAAKGSAFLAHFSPAVGNPFAGTPEWDYFRECPGVFARFVADPPTDKATLTIKSLGQQQQPGSGSSGDTDIVLSGAELPQLQRQLLQVLSGTGPPGAPAAPAERVRLRPVGSSSSSSSSSSIASSAGGPAKLELLIDGGAVALLQQAHVVSLVTVVEDLTGQLPEQYARSTQQQAVQVTPPPALGRVLQGGLAWLSTAARAGAAAALLALPLIAMARPFRGLQLLPPSSPITTQAGGSTKGSTAASSSSVQRHKQPVLLNDQLSSLQLQQLCAAVARRVEGRVWLTREQAGIDAAAAASMLGAAGSSTATSSSDAGQPVAVPGPLLFQVMASKAGVALGLTPASPAAAAVLWELPLAVDLRGPALAKVHERRLAAVLPESSSPASKPAKKAPPPSGSQISYEAVQQQTLPAEGVAVLKLQLTPAAASGAAVAGDVAVGQPAPVSQQQQPALPAGVRRVGSGKAAVEMWLMQAAVSPWTDADSLAVWASRGAVLQQRPEAGPSQEQRAAGGAGSVSAAADAMAAPVGSSDGLSLMLDGKPVESFDAFMQQLLAASQQQQQP